MIHRLAPLLLALLAVAALAQQRTERLLSADVTPAGELVTATLRGADRVVFSVRSGDVVSNEEIELVGLSDADAVVQARVGRAASSHFVALVLRGGEKHSYHYAVLEVPDAGAPVNPFPQLPRYVISDALFESTGEPYRLVSAATPGGDAIEIVFQRGWAPSGSRADANPAPAIEQRIYHNRRPDAGPAAGALWDVTGVTAAGR